MNQKFSDHLQGNLNLLKKYHPEVWQLMTKIPPEPSGEIVLSQEGLPNLQLTNKNDETVLLHLEENPQAEIPQFLKLVPAKATGFVSMLGMGLGYTPLALLQERPTICNLAVFELDKGVFLQALRAMDLSPLLSDPRVILIVGQDYDIPQTLAHVSNSLLLESIFTLRHLPTFNLHPDTYQKLDDDFFNYTNKLNINGATTLAFGTAYLTNRFRQLTAIRHDHFLDRLKNTLAGIPVILVAGGPSLNKNIHLLPQAKGKAILIAVDSVLPNLTAHGIVPDFVCSIDPQEITYEKFANLAFDLNETALICPPWITPRVPKYLQTKEVFWIFSQGNMERWLNNLLGGELTFAGVGTVGQLNLYAAIILGGSPIIFVGQDLAYSDGHDHAAKTVLSNQEFVQKQLKNKQGILWVKGTLGDEVATNRSFLGMIQTFEHIISQHPGLYINATEGGAHIEGTEVMPLKKALDQHCSTNHDITALFTSILEKTARPNHNKMDKEFRAIQNKCKDLQKIIKKSDHLTHQSLDAISKQLQQGRKFTTFKDIPPALGKKIIKIDGYNKELDKSKIWHILQEITLEGLRKSAQMKLELDKLENDPKQYMLWIQKSLERHLCINEARKTALTLFLGKLTSIIKHLHKEQKLLTAIQKENSPWQEKLELALLYMDSGDIKIARPIFENLSQTHANSPELFFQLGRIASHQSNFQGANDYFAKSREIDSSFDEKIKSFTVKIGDEYLQFARHYKNVDGATYKKMLLKGLQHCADHPEIKKQILAAIKQDVKKIGSAIDSEPPDEAILRLATFWHEPLQVTPNLEPILPTEHLASLYYFYGRVCAVGTSFPQAVESYSKALFFSPDDARINIACTDAYFNLGDFSKGVEHLAKAVSLDRSYAHYWEQLGDSLNDAEQFSDAIAAYEQCYVTMPENLELLKKIGDCYLAQGQPEAAHEAYSQFKNKITG